MFSFWAMPHQMPPEGDWRTWVILGGRGAGKTRAGAEWVRAQVTGTTAGERGLRHRVGLIAETYEQAREVMVFGESGIIAISPEGNKPKWIAGRRLLEWPNGATAQVFSAQDFEALRGPQFDAVWVDELGCAAIDKGTNQPNKFLDPKSSESKIPRYSNGMRDDFIQMQYLRAMFGFYAQTTNNPISVEYAGPMIDMTRAHVWAWDARPYPFFPAVTSLWSDGDNYARGHWLNGRSSSRTLANVVAEICTRSGVNRFDVSRLYGLVRGYVVDDVTTARSALQPLMLTYGFDAIERNGMLVFENRKGKRDFVITDAELALDPARQAPVTLARAPMAEVTRRVQLGYIDAEADYEAGVSEAIQPDETTFGVARSEVPLALTRGEGARTVARWLQEARLATDTASFALPPSQNQIVAGDVIALDAFGYRGLYRIDRMEEAGLRLIEATRVNPEVYLPQELYEEGAILQPHVNPTPVEMVFLDLPLLTGDEAPNEPFVAATARPWPGSVALYSSPQDNDYVLQEVLRNRATVGKLTAPVVRGPLGIWDRQQGVALKLVSGALSSADPLSVLAGANTIAIGDGTPDNWEIIQFAQAEPTGNRRFEISQLLRGQVGTSAMMQDIWPAGSFVVIMNGKPKQITIPSASRGLERHYRFGPTKLPLSSNSYKHVTLSFKGNGYRPYPVTHLKMTNSGNTQVFSWIRATRIDGDIWGAGDVPLGEETELYEITITQGGLVKRQLTTSSATYSYSAAQQKNDLTSGTYQLVVTQVSARFGAGSEKTMTVESLT